MFRVNDKVCVKVFSKTKDGKEKNVKKFKAIIKGIYEKFILLQHIGQYGPDYTECFLRYQFKNGEVKLMRYKHE